MEPHKTNPYLPPNSKIEDRESEKGSPKKAVIAACSVDIFGSFIMSIILGGFYGFILAAQGLSQEEIALSYSSQGILSPLRVLSMICGLSISIYSGYLCAKIGRCTHYKLVTIYLVIVVVLMNFLSAIAGQDISTIKNIILTTLSILAGYFGAWLYIKDRDSSARE
jgi:hypothetical protein